MRVLIGYSRCSISQEAFASRGHDCWTCDLLSAEHPRHLQCNIWDVARDNWDLAIFHPMCTYLTVSAAWAFKDPDYERFPGVGYHQRVKPGTLTGAERREARAAELKNFRMLLDLPYPKAIENPGRSFVATAIRRPDQLIQPYEFGENASKITGLWLDRLPRLRPTKRIIGRFVNGIERWSNQTDSGQNRLTPGENRWLERSATYPGIARAFGQWA